MLDKYIQTIFKVYALHNILRDVDIDFPNETYSRFLNSELETALKPTIARCEYNFSIGDDFNSLDYNRQMIVRNIMNDSKGHNSHHKGLIINKIYILCDLNLAKNS